MKALEKKRRTEKGDESVQSNLYWAWAFHMPDREKSITLRASTNHARRHNMKNIDRIST